MLLRTVVIAFLLSLTACGWQLRGSVSLPAGMEPLYIGGANNGQLAVEVRNLLAGNGVQLTDNASEANYQLQVASAGAEKRSLSLGGGTTTAEYQLTESAIFSLIDDGGQVVLGPETISQRRILRNDPNAVLSSDEEERLLRRELQSVLAAQIARRIAKYRAPQNDATPSTEP
jgi:LPS-assembly lipoprotein